MSACNAEGRLADVGDNGMASWLPNVERALRRAKPGWRPLGASCCAAGPVVGVSSGEP